MTNLTLHDVLALWPIVVAIGLAVAVRFWVNRWLMDRLQRVGKGKRKVQEVQREPPPADDEVIPRDRTIIPGLMAILGGLFVAAGLWCGVEAIKSPKTNDDYKAFLFVAALALGSGGWLLHLRQRFLQENARIVIRSDRLLYVTGLNSPVGEIPFDNLEAAFLFHNANGMPSVGLCVRDPARGDTRWPVSRFMRKANRTLGYEYSIDWGFVEPPSLILERLDRRLDAYRRSRERTGS